MSNPNIPVIPVGAAAVNKNPADDEDTLPVNNEDVDDGETTDDQATVENDMREASEANDRLNE